MELKHIPELKKQNTQRCTVWMDKDQKAYIEDLAYSSKCNQRDALYHIIAQYAADHPIQPFKRTNEPSRKASSKKE